PRLRAGLAHLLGEKYVFSRTVVPGIRAALGLDTEAVQAAYRSLYAQPLESIYALRPGPADRMRWLSVAVARWVQSLPPLWSAAVLILTLSMPQSILALPIAVAGIGPLPGLIIVLAVGLVNMLTIACMAEALSRNGAVRYGDALIGRVVTDYL